MDLCAFASCVANELLSLPTLFPLMKRYNWTVDQLKELGRCTQTGTGGGEFRRKWKLEVYVRFDGQKHVIAVVYHLPQSV